VKAEKIREMGPEDLRNKERELQEQLFRLRFQKSIGQLDNALKIREVRRDVARVKTVLRQRSAAAAAGKAAEATK
jgi:large subunit ribosomal protein L29